MLSIDLFSMCACVKASADLSLSHRHEPTHTRHGAADKHKHTHVSVHGSRPSPPDLPAHAAVYCCGPFAARTAGGWDFLFVVWVRRSEERREQQMERRSEEEEEEEENEEGLHFERLDDEIAASVFEKRANQPETDSINQLTSDNFHTEVAQSYHTVALFYLKWDAVSMEFLSSFLNVAKRLSDSEVNNVQMSVVDCGEWTDLCAAQLGTPVPFQPITSFPSVLLLRPQQPAQLYRGMLGSEALHRFIMMSLTASPMLLSTQEEVTSFLQEAPHPELAGYRLDRILGLFRTSTETGFSIFTEAAKSLRGEVLSGLLTGEPAQEWAAEQDVHLPVVMLFPSWRTDARPSAHLTSSSVKELLTHINTARIHPVPELTVENLPFFLSLGKALLLLFVGEEEDEFGWRQSQALVEELRGVKTDHYLTCWIHLGRTPAGMSVLGSYLGSMPPLPALVLTHLPTRDEVYQFPPNTPIVASSVQRWLQEVQDGSEPPAGTLGEDSWPPAFDFYDFLKVMDLQEPDSTEQKPPLDGEEEVNVEEHLVAEPPTDIDPKFHSEL
ncbi:thioredoxin domain-containing protein 16 [Austrofundulus limnaeus]|uniref:Thioredoxin domain-containing protein 16 n=1 Tax=Austrofundulus limnaeus TaxID=52670 RepID=A0A2I4BBJ7_AUSLI|nr:PREDICTED: thioredoxin domain-containing protein 16-like [Austrofundulus limnaeus]